MKYRTLLQKGGTMGWTASEDTPDIVFRIKFLPLIESAFPNPHQKEHNADSPLGAAVLNQF